MGACLTKPQPAYPVRHLPGPYDRAGQVTTRPDYNRVDAPARPAPAVSPQRPDDSAQGTDGQNTPAESPAKPAAEAWSWKRLSPLGKGAFGTVYLGLTSTGQLMAVKQVEKPVAGDEQTRKNLQNSIRELEGEIVTLQKLKHPNIVQYYGCERTDTHINIFLEWVPCGSLRKLLDEHGPLTEGIVRKYTQEVLQGLRHLHKMGIMHRDIKGQNVLVDQGGHTKLADFGASTQIHTVMDSVSRDDQANCSFKGTPFFMAPEVVTGKGHGRQADIWSLGCLVFEMLTAKPPWADQLERNTNMWNAMLHIVNNKDPPKVPDHISPEARDFLERCWERDPFRRPNCDRLLAHPFIRGGAQRVATPPDATMQTPRVHPTVGAHPSPIQEEGAVHEAQDPRKTPEKPPRMLHGQREYGVSPRRPGMPSAGLNIGPALGPSALEQPRPGTGGGRAGMHAAAPPPRVSPAYQRQDSRVQGGEHPPPAAHAGGNDHGTPLRPATARAPSASPKGETLPARPATASAAPTVLPPPEATLTPEGSAVGRTPAGAQTDESPDVPAQNKPEASKPAAPAWMQSFTSFNPMMSYQYDLMTGVEDLDDATSAPPPTDPVDTSEDGLDKAEQATLALHRKSVAKSVSKVLAESGALGHFKNMSNPLYGTQNSVTQSHAGLVAPHFPAPLSVGPGAAAGAPLSPISENTNSRQWQSTESLRQSKATAVDESNSGFRLDRKVSAASTRPSTAGTDTPKRESSGRLRVSEQPRMGSGVSAGALALSAVAPPNGDMNSFMEDMLSKERTAFRKQHRLKMSTEASRQGLRRSDGSAARSMERYGGDWE